MLLLVWSIFYWEGSNCKTTVIDPTEDNFTQQLSIKEILDELKISKDDYYRALSLSKDEVKLNYKKGLLVWKGRGLFNAPPQHLFKCRNRI